MDLHRVSICGVSVDCVDSSRVIERVDELLSRGTPSAIFAVNPEKIIQCGRNERLRKALEESALLIPDGIGVVVAVRLLRRERIARVPGCELMPALCEFAAQRGLSVFLFGGAPGVAESAGAELSRRNPGLRLAGWEHGYLDPESVARLIERINALKPDMLFVGLGSPRQELWIAENISKLDIKICQAVGGTLDVLAGKVKRCPKPFRVVHLEWLYRLLSQPMRATRQSALPIFAGRVLREYMSRNLLGRRVNAGQP